MHIARFLYMLAFTKDVEIVIPFLVQANSQTLTTIAPFTLTA